VFAIGHANEDRFAEYLDGQFVKYDREFALSIPVLPGITLEGHSDFVTESCVYELKCVVSENSLAKVSKEPKQDNLAQLVNYMDALGRSHGKLIYTSYLDVLNYKTMGKLDEFDADALTKSSTREMFTYEVDLSPEGCIFINGRECDEFTIHRDWEHRKLAAQVVLNGDVYPDRPIGKGFFPPCYSCPFDPVCTKFDRRELSEELFIDRCKEIVNG
jgi:hypothetical protein